VIPVTLRFYEELNRFLPPADRKKDLSMDVPDRTSAAEAIRRLGVPLAEVDLLLVNGEPAGFDRRLAPDDRVTAYPEFERLDVGPLTLLAGRPLRRPCFVTSEPDLEPLVERLREKGWDVRFDPSLTEEALVEITRRDRRILLSSKPHLLSRGRADRGVLVGKRGGAGTLARHLFQALDLPAQGDATADPRGSRAAGVPVPSNRYGAPRNPNGT
jgi:hypothetical protein